MLAKPSKLLDFQCELTQQTIVVWEIHGSIDYQFQSIFVVMFCCED